MHYACVAYGPLIRLHSWGLSHIWNNLRFLHPHVDFLCASSMNFYGNTHCKRDTGFYLQLWQWYYSIEKLQRIVQSNSTWSLWNLLKWNFILSTFLKMEPHISQLTVSTISCRFLICLLMESLWIHLVQ